MSEDYAKDIVIDKYNLDVEWELQPAVYLEWAARQAQAILERDQCKQRIDVLCAKLDKHLRTVLEEELGKKPTEGAISARISLDPEYQEIHNEFHQLNYQVNILTAARTAFEHRKKALESLTQLYISSYYSKPHIPEDSKFKVGEKRKENDQTLLSRKMQRRMMPKDK